MDSLSTVEFFPSYQNHSQHLHFVPSLHLSSCCSGSSSKVDLPWVPSISDDKLKIIHCVVFNKVVHIIHPSRSMPFFRTPSNDRLWLPQAGIKSFNDLCIKSNSFCHLREMLYESPFPKVSRYGIMAIISSLLWNHAPSYSSVELLPTKLNLRHLFLPSLSMCVLCLSSRDVSTSHSMSWSWVARSLRRSIPVEFPSLFIVLDEDLEDKDVKSNVMQYIGIFEKGSWIEKTVIVLWPLCLLTPLLESRDEILVLVGVSCHIPSSGNA